MTMLRRAVFVGLLALCAALPVSQAEAQTVWRCGAEGRSYSQTPCSDGRPVAVADARAADEVAEARAVAVREQRLADELRAQRHLREAAWRQAATGPAAVRNSGLGSQAGDAEVQPAARKPPKPKPTQKSKAKPARPALADEGARTSPSTARGSRQTRG